MALKPCPHCDGFVAPRSTHCPHCGEAVCEVVGTHRVWATAVLGATASMTLMACYGAPIGGPVDTLDEGFDGGDIGGDGDGDGDGDSEVCADAPTVDLGSEPTMVAGSAVNAASNNRGSCGGAGREQVFAWTPSLEGTYRVSTEGDADLVLYVRTELDTCGFEETCADSAIGGESVVIDAVAQQPLYIFVDHFNAGEGSQFDLTIEAL